jgi:hypothetical protein
MYVVNIKDETPRFTKSSYVALPALGLPVQVQCDGFKCMAFRDHQGRWVDLFTRKFLPRVLGMILAGSN